MDRDSVERLRHDRRLVSRREWVSAEDRAAFFESLPDVSDKMTRGFDEPEEKEAAAPAETTAQDHSFSSTPSAPSAATSFGTGETAADSTSGPTPGSSPFGGGVGGGSDSSGSGNFS